MEDAAMKELEKILRLAEKISGSQIQDSIKEKLFEHLLSKYFEGAPEDGRSESKHRKPSDDTPQFNNAIKQFIRKFEVDPKALERVFYVEEEKVDFAISDLKARNNKEGLQTCMCLVGVKNAILTSRYDIPLKELRETADNFGVYDQANFSQYMKQSQDFLKKYEPGKDTELSVPGMKKAAELVKKLGVA